MAAVEMDTTVFFRQHLNSPELTGTQATRSHHTPTTFVVPLLGPWTEAICLVVVLAFAATEIPFICCQIAAPRIFAELGSKCIWHELHLRVPVPPFDVQRRIVGVYARQIHKVCLVASFPDGHGIFAVPDSF